MRLLLRQYKLFVFIGACTPVFLRRGFCILQFKAVVLKVNKRPWSFYFGGFCIFGTARKARLHLTGFHMVVGLNLAISDPVFTGVFVYSYHAVPFVQRHCTGLFAPLIWTAGFLLYISCVSSDKSEAANPEERLDAHFVFLFAPVPAGVFLFSKYFPTLAQRYHETIPKLKAWSFDTPRDSDR